jgi:hypothetical protein
MDAGKVRSSMFHYTNASGYNGIRSTPEWLFRAAQPPGDPEAHPFGAYFTDLPENEPMLAKSCGSRNRSSATSSLSSTREISIGSAGIAVGTSSTLG